MTTRRTFAAGLAGAVALAPHAAHGQPLARFDEMMRPESLFNGAPREILPLWPHRPPGAPRPMPPQEVIERSEPPALRDRSVLHVARPVLIVFRPERPNGAAILMCTGGAYRRVVLDKEGFESAEIFAARGITTFQLIYRLPGDAWGAGPDTPLQDAQRAMRVVWSRAAEYGIDPERIAAMGFSAGGHTAGSLAVRFDANAYDRVDIADDQPARPKLSVLIYPVISMRAPDAHAETRAALLGENPCEDAIIHNSIDTHARADAPPTFLLHAADDEAVPISHSLVLYRALRTQRVATEMHLFEAGGHGFGTRFTVGRPTSVWPDLVCNWFAAHGLLGA